MFWKKYIGHFTLKNYFEPLYNIAILCKTCCKNTLGDLQERQVNLNKMTFSPNPSSSRSPESDFWTGCSKEMYLVKLVKLYSEKHLKIQINNRFCLLTCCFWYNVSGCIFDSKRIVPEIFIKVFFTSLTRNILCNSTSVIILY
jgi:hypothetical protein